MNDIEKASTLFQGVCSGDPAHATKQMDPERYVDHSPRARDGIEGVKRLSFSCKGLTFRSKAHLQWAEEQRRIQRPLLVRRLRRERIVCRRRPFAHEFF